MIASVCASRTTNRKRPQDVEYPACRRDNARRHPGREAQDIRMVGEETIYTEVPGESA